MKLLIILLLLQSGFAINKNGPRAGIELRPDDPHRNNGDLMVKCIQQSNGGGCNVRFTPGEYYIYKPIEFPSGVLDANLEGVLIHVCAKMGFVFSTIAIGPWGSAYIHHIAVISNVPCGTWRPEYAYQPFFEVIRRR